MGQKEDQSASPSLLEALGTISPEDIQAVIGDAKIRPLLEAVIGEADIIPGQERGETPGEFPPAQERGEMPPHMSGNVPYPEVQIGDARIVNPGYQVDIGEADIKKGGRGGR